MRGKILLFILFILPFVGKPQSFPQDSIGIVKYEEIVASTLNKGQLYNNAKLFAVLAFNNPKSVIQIDDKENGKLVIKASLNSNVNAKGILGFKFDIWTNFVFHLDIKDNKYKYKIDNLFIDFSGDMAQEYLSAEDLIKKIDKKQKAKYKSAVYKSVEQSVNGDLLLLINNLKKQMLTTDDDF